MPSSPKEEHEKARRAALHLVKMRGSATMRALMEKTGLAEILAKKALEDLVKTGVLFKVGRTYRMRAPTR